MKCPTCGTPDLTNHESGVTFVDPATLRAELEYMQNADIQGDTPAEMTRRCNTRDRMIRDREEALK